MLPVGGVITDPQPRNQIMGANTRGDRAFALDTVCLPDFIHSTLAWVFIAAFQPGKYHVFTTPNQAEASRWVKEIQALMIPPS